MAENDRDTAGRFTGSIDDADVIAAVRAHDPAATSEIGEELGISRQGADRRLRSLRDAGGVSSKKIGASLVWFIPRDRGHRESDARADAGDGAGQPRGDPPADAHGADAGGEADALDAVLADLPSTVDPADARETIHTVREYLREAGPASKATIVREIMPTHPLGYDPDAALAKIDAGDRYRGAWWRKVVKPGLEALPDVSKPPAGASEWKATGPRE